MMAVKDLRYDTVAPDPVETGGKIRSLRQVADLVAKSKADGRRVCHAHGAFDFLHLGHVQHLEAARRFGDLLVVTVTADRFIRKGPGRPVFTAEQRVEMLAALQCVDLVAVVDAADAVGAIEEISPDFYIKGQDYADARDDVTGKIIDERNAVEAAGGALVFTDGIKFSSTALIETLTGVLI